MIDVLGDGDVGRIPTLAARRVSDPLEPSPFAAEVRLAHAVATGDRNAAEAFARRLLPVVRRTTSVLVRDAAEAQDAVQQTLLELLRSAANYRGEAPLAAWARRITARVVLRHLERVRAKAAHALDERFDAPADAMSTTMLDELPRPLEHYLGELPEAQRIAIVLRHTLGHTVPEIAEITGAAIPTVKSRLQKAQQELRRSIRRDLNLGLHGKARTP